jgi:hypothetical protein
MILLTHERLWGGLRVVKATALGAVSWTAVVGGAFQGLRIVVGNMAQGDAPSGSLKIVVN